jgi:hypothetical protein
MINSLQSTAVQKASSVITIHVTSDGSIHTITESNRTITNTHVRKTIEVNIAPLLSGDIISKICVVEVYTATGLDKEGTT